VSVAIRGGMKMCKLCEEDVGFRWAFIRMRGGVKIFGTIEVRRHCKY
jgi:hypothetical protein